MSRVIRGSPRWWLRQHLKGTEHVIPCAECRHYAVQYRDRGEADRACPACNKNLNYWPYSNAPGWCPRRPANRFLYPGMHLGPGG